MEKVQIPEQEILVHLCVCLYVHVLLCDSAIAPNMMNNPQHHQRVLK